MKHNKIKEAVPVLAYQWKLFFLICFTMTTPSLSANEIDRQIYMAWRDVASKSYLVPSQEEMDIVSNQFHKLLTLRPEDPVDEKIVGKFNQLNFKLETLYYKGKRLFIIYEDKPQFHGRGFFILRPEGESVMLQAPHAYADLHTGSLGIKLMLESNYSVLAVNTVSRKYIIPELGIKADMAHIDNSYFISVSDAFTRIHTDAYVLQLHGFNAAKRDITKDVSVIISAGVKSPPLKIKSEADCLKQLSNYQIRTYPDEIDVLGGTKNRIGRYLSHMNFTGFRHIELSLPLRKKMLKSQKVRDKFLSCFSS